jgi:RNA polymerase sigma-70 factor (ECF subfamily)
MDEPRPGYGLTMSLDDAVLVARAREGELRAFEELVVRYRDPVFRLATRIVGPDEAEDVAQDAFLRAFHRLNRFRGEGSFRTWLLRIAHNAALDELARRRAKQDEPLAEEDAPAKDPEEERLPLQAIEVQERRQRLAEKIRLLRESHRAVLVLRDLEGLSYEQIAAVTETPVGSVKGRLHRARAELMEILRANTYDWELPR